MDGLDLEEVLDQFGGVLRAAIVRTAPAHLDVDDIEQEARLRLWKALTEERPIGRLDSYIYRVGVTTAIDALRKARARREEQWEDDEGRSVEDRGVDPGVPPSTWPEALSRRREVVLVVNRCLKKLGDNRGRAVGLHLHGVRRREIATMLHWTEAKVRNLVSRGLKDLRECCRAAGIEIPETW